MRALNTLFAAPAVWAMASFCVLPSLANAQKSSDTLAMKPDSGLVAHGGDTNVPTPVRTVEGDSLTKNRLMPDSAHKAADTTSTAPPLPRGAAMPEDTTYRFWQHPYWGIGAGWGLGSFPLFSEWESGLPDSSARLAGPGSTVPKFTIREPVNSYNIFWPLLVSVTPFVNERQALSIEGSLYLFFSGKTFQASLAAGNDSLPSSVEWNQSCAATFFSLGLDYRRRIPEEYFKVENVKRTTANIGLSAVPLMRFSKRSSFSARGIPDSTIARLEGKMDNRTFYGMGCSWKIGISSLRKLSPKSGVEIGISYIGRYLGYFKNGRASMAWKDLNPHNGRAEEKISFLSHTFEISLVLQNGKAGPKR
jgi:hypothetical protein